MPLNYRMDRMSGRLVGASSKGAFNPQAFTAVEAVPILKSSLSEKPAPTATVRAMSDMKTALHIPETIKQTEVLGKIPDSAVYRKLQDKQRLMMRPDGRLVWQKLPMDMPLYRTTMGLCVLGLAMTGALCYKMAFNKKADV